MEHNKRVEQIKTYLERLSAGEELEKVRADFAKEFEAVDPAEIMQAEQELLQGGTPLETVQKLCDVGISFDASYQKRRSCKYEI